MEHETKISIARHAVGRSVVLAPAVSIAKRRGLRPHAIEKSAVFVSCGFVEVYVFSRIILNARYVDKSLLTARVAIMTVQNLRFLTNFIRSCFIRDIASVCGCFIM